MCFRCGDKDASKLEDGFAYFDSTDLQSLGVGQAIARVGQKDHDFNLSFDLSPKIDAEVAESKYRTVIDHCRSTYALHYSQVEEILKEALNISKPVQSTKVAKEEVAPIKQIIKDHDTREEKTKNETDLKSEAQKFIDKETEKEKQREHRFIQEFVKKIAEARNFKAVMEEPVNDYAGKVDVSLLREDLKIACEISVTNTAEYEVKNIQKCFAADYALVFMLSNDPKHLSDIRALAVREIDEVFHGRLYFVSKDDFVNQLDLILTQKSQPTEIRAKGYRVKVSYASSEDTLGQQRALTDVVLSSLRRKDKEKYE